MKAVKTRDRIIAAADDLFYRQGYEKTSFADIANAVNISRGNFYYHFQAKDEILEGVIARRLADRGKMLGKWQEGGKTPKERIRCFINILAANQDKIKRFGCPVGTLSTELAKLGHPNTKDANRLFMLFRTWLERQFVQLGFGARSDEMALHVLAWSQGVATLANAFRDDRFVNREIGAMNEWLDQCLEQSPQKKTKEKM